MNRQQGESAAMCELFSSQDHKKNTKKTPGFAPLSHTFDAWGVEITWTVLGLTPFALGRL